MQYRTLREDKLLETVEGLGRKVTTCFPTSGLSKVAAEVTALTREALSQAERISRPAWGLRILLILLALLGVALAVWVVAANPHSLAATLLDAARSFAIYIVAIVLFFYTLETRLKRNRALEAVHQLRAMAHIIDMHQLAKDPERLASPDGPSEGKFLTPEQMRRYLVYCTELLSLVSKLGQLYIQGFPDAQAMAAVDQFEALATGLSQKIWQKLMILDQYTNNGIAGESRAVPAKG
jgi:uncharacterized membrane protein YbhN (UPF0104 family)